MLANLSLSSTPTPSGLLFKQKSSTLTSSSFHGVRIPSPNPNSVSFHWVRARPSSVVMMAKRDEELNEIRTMTNEELNDEVLRLKGELFVLRLQKSVREAVKYSEFGRMRKRIARLLTVKREREIEQGIGKRLSRKLDKEWKRNIVVKPPAFLNLQKEKADKKD